MPGLFRSSWWKASAVGFESDDTHSCFSCGLVWTRLRPEDLRASIEENQGELGKQLLTLLESGPYHDLPDLPEAREAGRKVVAIDNRLLCGDETDAAILFRDLMNVDWNTARTALSGWKDLTRLRKLALCGWQQKEALAPRPPEHPLRDAILDGV